MIHKMIILELRNCRVCINPLFGILEIAVIIVLLKTVIGMSTPGLHFVDFIIISFLILAGSLCSLFIHEYAHVLAARRVGLKAKEITVSCFGAFTLLNGEALQPKQAIIVSAAGPVANFIAGMTSYAGHVVLLQSDSISMVCLFLSVFNCMLSIYNLMPVMPLDGGMILRSVLWLVTGSWGWSTQRALLFGNGFAALCISAGILLFLWGHSIISGVLSVLGLSLWQNEKSAYQKILGAKIVTIVDLRGLERR